MKRMTRFLVLPLGVAAVLLLVLTSTSSKTEAEATPEDSCGPVLYVPPGSTVTPKGEFLLVTYPDNTAVGIDCDCSEGSGDCTEATSGGSEIYCKELSGCTDCKASVVSIQ